jgi:spermidine/putrescine transport system substrate-binding protein
LTRKTIRALSLALAVLLLLAAAGCSASKAEGGAPKPAEGKTTINVYNWGQYISDGSDGYIDVNAAFTEATGIEVNYMTYDSNETLYTKLKTGGSTYDVIIPSDYMIARLIKEGLLAELDFNNIPNYRYVEDAYKNTEYDPENRYSVPYTWGCVGVIYNKKYVDEADVGGWDLLWNEKYAGKILMFDNLRDAFGIAELSLGYGLNTEDPAELEAAAGLLLKQRPLVQSYVMDQIFSKMEREEAWIAPYYAGDYLTMAQENENLAFYYPKEGFNMFVDAMCVPIGSDNKEAAEAYINFMCDPSISGQNLDYLGYSTPIRGAKDYMDAAVASSEVAYPPEETLARGQTFLNLSDGTLQKMESLWLGVKTNGSNSGLIYAAAGLAALILLLAAVFIRRKKRLAKRRSMYGK